MQVVGAGDRAFLATPTCDTTRFDVRAEVGVRVGEDPAEVEPVVVLLAGSGVRMLSVDIFLWTVTGRQEAGTVLALIQTALVIVGYAAARLIARRTFQQAAQ